MTALASVCSSLFNAFGRKKTVHSTSLGVTVLRRCLTLLDLTFLGVGSTLGAGIYIVAGDVANKTAGPAVTISFLIAAIASFLAGICYAEFAAKVPRAGSAYVYSYVTMGELIAFIIGWNLILEYVIGTASVSRAWSGYIDSLTNHTLTAYFQEHLPISSPHLSPYFDPLAFGVTIAIMGVLAFGVKESTLINNVFTFVNLTVVLLVICAGASKAHLYNWQLPPRQEFNGTVMTNHTLDEGGFTPYGVSGIISGAATCFYAFVGFDAIATTGEEVLNPQRNLPLSILLCLVICFIAYFGVSSVITLMVPYYMLDVDASVSKVFGQVGLHVLEYIVAVGVIAGLTSSLLGGMIPMPRILYAMSGDGLIFRWLSYVPERFQTPVIATVVAGFFTALMAGIFQLATLVEMMAIGTLLAYTIVALCVLVLRYQPTTEIFLPIHEENNEGLQVQPLNQPLVAPKQEGGSFVRRLLYPGDAPSTTSGRMVYGLSLLLCLELFFLCCVIDFLLAGSVGVTWWTLTLLVTIALITLVTLLVINRQPTTQPVVQPGQNKPFQVGLVPWLPALSITMNIYLILKLQVMTWVRFAIWMVFGFLIYFGYGIWHSNERLCYQSME